MSRRAIIVGHSFVFRLQDFTNKFVEWNNLKFDGTDIQVQYSDLGGLLLRHVPTCHYPTQNMAAFLTYKPQVVYLDIGGNELCNPTCDPELVATHVISFANSLVSHYGVNHVVIGQTLFRFSMLCPVNFNENAVAINNCVKYRLREYTRISFWSLRGMWKDIGALLCEDGIHLNNNGMVKYAKNIKACLGSCIRRNLF